MFGTSETVKTDNGPPFNGCRCKFADFAKHLGFKHQKITPLWPQANGLNERFMQSITKSITAAIAEGKPWRPELDALLRSYRATPHTTTKIAPAALMFRYNANTSRLPKDDSHSEHYKLEEIARQNHQKAMLKVDQTRNKQS